MLNRVGSLAASVGPRLKAFSSVLHKHGLKGFGSFFGMELAFRTMSGELREHPASAVLHAASTAALFTAFPEYFLFTVLKGGAQALVSGGYAFSYSQQMKYRSYTSRQIGGTYRDNQLSLTMRQRGIAEIQSAKMNARSALGQEALMMHRRIYEF